MKEEMNNDLIYEELREAITKDLNDLKLIFAENGITQRTFDKLFRENIKECDFFEQHLIDRIQKNIKNLQNYLKEE